MTQAAVKTKVKKLTHVEELTQRIGTLQELREADRNEKWNLENKIEQLKKEVDELSFENTTLRSQCASFTEEIARRDGYIDRVQELESPRMGQDKQPHGATRLGESYNTDGVSWNNMPKEPWYKRRTLGK